MERGFAGKILWVDLTKKEFTTQKVDDQIYKGLSGRIRSWPLKSFSSTRNLNWVLWTRPTSWRL